MSETTGSELQFGHAEYGAEGATASACAGCGRPLRTIYYEVNGQVTCPACKVALASTSGSRVGRFLRALFYGSLAGLVGAAVWYGVRAASGYEFGLIAIGVGLLVGVGVLKGSGNRGGWRYQALAMALTYGSIVSTYVPDILEAMGKMGEQEAAAVPGEATGDDEETAGEAEAEAVSASETTPAPAAGEQAAPVSQMGAGQGVLMVGVFFVLVMAIAFAAPFLGGFENIMGIVIIGIALYEAWKINKKRVLEIAGPFRVAPAHGAAHSPEPEPPPPPIEPGG